LVVVVVVVVVVVDLVFGLLDTGVEEL